MFWFNILKDNYYDKKITENSQGYNKFYLKEKIKKEGLTKEIEHDLLLVTYNEHCFSIPYKAFNKLDAKLLYLWSDIHFIIHQKRIINETVKDIFDIPIKQGIVMKIWAKIYKLIEKHINNDEYEKK